MDLYEDPIMEERKHERLREEVDQIEFNDLRFERLRKARRRQKRSIYCMFLG